MKVVVDARMLYWTGVGRYTETLLDNLEKIDPHNQYVILRRPADRALWSPSTSNFSVIDVDIDPYSVAEQFRLPSIIRSLKPDLVHFTAANAPVLYSGKRVITVHDLTLLDHDTSRGFGIQRLVRRLKRLPYRFIVSCNLQYAQGIITPTKYVKDEIVTRFKARPNRVHVTHLAAYKNAAQPVSIERFHLGNKYLLFVGNVYPYKNAGLILQALSLLRGKHPDLKLVVTSKPDFFRDKLALKAKQLGVSDNLIMTGFVTDGELVGLYRNAALYIYPSFSEGFGLQALESMAQGLPLLAARSSSLPEVCGDAAEYFDPYDASDLAAKIDYLLTDDARRNELIRLGRKRSDQFSWLKTAQDTLVIYQELKSS
jgi:glycosyltransferase involved in cell wall biosynthesis